jgi:hypothetical protein
MKKIDASPFDTSRCGHSRVGSLGFTGIPRNAFKFLTNSKGPFDVLTA